MEEFWRLFLQSHDAFAREKLIIFYAPLVKRVVGRMLITLPPSLDYNDLINYGIIGLIDAIEKFDPNRGVKFETYAVARIRGAIFDQLRAFDWIPRSIRQKAKIIEKAYSEVENKLGRSATDAEIAEYLGIAESELVSALEEVNRGIIIPLDDLVGSESDGASLFEYLEDKNGVNPLQKMLEEELYDNLAEAVDCLPEREKIVVSLYYYEGLTLKEIGKVLGITESRVCQLHTRSLMRLRGKLSINKMGLEGKK